MTPPRRPPRRRHAPREGQGDPATFGAAKRRRRKKRKAVTTPRRKPRRRNGPRGIGPLLRARKIEVDAARGVWQDSGSDWKRPRTAKEPHTPAQHRTRPKRKPTNGQDHRPNATGGDRRHPATPPSIQEPEPERPPESPGRAARRPRELRSRRAGRIGDPRGAADGVRQVRRERAGVGAPRRVRRLHRADR